MIRQILLLRSARHLDTALDALRGAYPDARIVVCTGAGADPLLGRAGIPVVDRVVGSWTHFSPIAIMRSAAGRSLLRRPADLVAVMWSDRDGRGHDNVTRTALLISPRGFVAITPDGVVLPQPSGITVAREVWRALRSAAAAVTILALLVIPARVMRAAGR